MEEENQFHSTKQSLQNTPDISEIIVEPRLSLLLSKKMFYSGSYCGRRLSAFRKLLNFDFLIGFALKNEHIGGWTYYILTSVLLAASITCLVISLFDAIFFISTLTQFFTIFSTFIS